MVIALMLAAMLGGDPDEVIATAPVGAQPPLVDAVAPVGVAVPPQDPHGLTTEQQIDRWLSARSGPDMLAGDSAGAAPERRMWGEIGVEIGNHGHQAYGGSVSVPVGRTGEFSLHYGESRGQYPARRHDEERLIPYGADDRPFDPYW